MSLNFLKIHKFFQNYSIKHSFIFYKIKLFIPSAEKPISQPILALVNPRSNHRSYSRKQTKSWVIHPRLYARKNLSFPLASQILGKIEP